MCQFSYELPDSLKEYCRSCKTCIDTSFNGLYAYKGNSNSWRKMVGDKIIKPETVIKKIGYDNKFLIPDKNGVVLFKKINPQGSKDIAGILYDPSFIEVKLIQKMGSYTFERFSNNEEWFTIKINGNIYYTDVPIANCNYWNNGLDESDKGYYNKPMQRYRQYFII